MNYNDLSAEQKEMIDRAKNGENILVDACIGSGKTTAIQILCNELPFKSILYLTYNRLLKIDAQEKIKVPNTLVTNYHGYAWKTLSEYGIRVGQSNLIQTFNEVKPEFARFHILIIDEYQDIEQELADMLEIIKAQNPNIQIIAVGDMKQKIYDKTTLDVPSFIDRFLGKYTLLHFTRCFRLSKNIAEVLGNIWEKKIVGVNGNCKVMYMKKQEALDFMSMQKPCDLLCLGARYGAFAEALNYLEACYPQTFNKRTVYAAIREEDKGSVSPTKDTAIFTTFDSSKGLERRICVIFNYTLEYWETRLGKPMTKYEILRNIFCVAASRGKEYIIFVDDEEEKPLTPEDIISPKKSFKMNDRFTSPFAVSEMFDFKYREDVEDCFKLLNTKRVKNDEWRIDINNSDGMIDLAPCIGIYQEAMFFNGYKIDDEISLTQHLSRDKPRIKVEEDAVLDDKILALTAHRTSYNRYVTQVKPPFVAYEQAELLNDRLESVLDHDDTVQVGCWIEYTTHDKKLITLKGFCDVVKNGAVYELKYVEGFNHEHFLQCAVYMIALDLEKGYVWNTKNNEMYEITISDKDKFLAAVLKAITKGSVKSYAKSTHGVSDVKGLIAKNNPRFDKDSKKKKDSAEDNEPSTMFSMKKQVI